MNGWLRVTQALAALTCLAVVASCGSVGASDTRQAESAQEVATPKQFADILARGYIVDIEPLKSVEELAASATLIVRGHIDSIQTGRTFTSADGSVQRRTLLMVVAVGETYKGALNGSLVYVEVEAPLAGDAPVVDAAAPKQVDVMLYLEPIGELSPEENAAGFPASWPTGQTVYQPSRPEGASSWLTQQGRL